MSVKVDIVAGFLGTGKTTLINKLLPVISRSEKVVLIENEFGEIGIDGDLIASDLPIKEIYAGCICCTLAGSLIKAIEELHQQFHPDRIVIEPSGLSQLSDVVKACQSAKLESDLQLDHLITLVDITGFADEMDALGAFYLDQIRTANIILLSYTGTKKQELASAVAELRKHNPQAVMIEDDWFCMEDENLAYLLYATGQLEQNNRSKTDDHVPANAYQLPLGRIFTTWTQPYPAELTIQALHQALEELSSSGCGQIWRGKGIVKLAGGAWAHFDYTPRHFTYRLLFEAREAKMVFIGCDLNKQRLSAIFSAEENTFIK